MLQENVGKSGTVFDDAAGMRTEYLSRHHDHEMVVVPLRGHAVNNLVRAVNSGSGALFAPGFGKATCNVSGAKVVIVHAADQSPVAIHNGHSCTQVPGDDSEHVIKSTFNGYFVELFLDVQHAFLFKPFAA